MLEVDALDAGYGRVQILHSVSVAVPDGGRLAVLGRNGMGKTTLLRAIMGSIAVTKGSVEFRGKDVVRWPTHKRVQAGLSLVPQGRDVFPRLSVEDNIKAAAFATHGPKGTVEEMFRLMPTLSEKRRALAQTLSGGQQQLLAIARSLACRPSVLLLDEPSEGIQPSIIEDIGSILLRVQAERSLAFVLVEQNLSLADRLTNEAIVLERGRIVHRGKTGMIARSQELQSRYLGV